jgi:hypothetical protein
MLFIYINCNSLLSINIYPATYILLKMWQPLWLGVTVCTHMDIG